MTETALRVPLGRVLRGGAPRPGGSTLPLAAWSYWWLVVGSATAAALLAPSERGGGWAGFLALTAAASVAQLASVQLPRNRVFHPALVFVVAGAFLLPPRQLALMCVVQHLPDWLRRRYAWYIQPFNIADYVLAALAAAAVVDAAGPAGATGAAVGAVVAFVSVNRILLAAMLGLGRRLSLRSCGLFAPDDVALELVLATMAVPFAALWPVNELLALLALAPLVLIQVTQRAYHRLERASETIQQQNERLVDAHELVVQRSTAALEALSVAVDARDSYTAGHSRRVRDLSLALGERLGLGDDELETLAQSALLHDIGKIGVPDSVLLKRGPLEPAEWAQMRAHPGEGARVIAALGYLDDVVPAILHHHERYDGGGYPARLAGEAIPLAARVIHVADALDAMLSSRVYRPGMPLGYALAQLRAGAGTDFCPRVLAALEQALADGAIAEEAAA